MSSLHPTARTEPALPVSNPAAQPIIREHAFDLRPFDELLPRLVADVGVLYGRGCRMAPAAVFERLYSYVLRGGVVHEGEPAARDHLFVKVSKYKVVDGSANGIRSRVEKDFAVTQRVYERMSTGDLYGAVRPVACYPAQ